jgi:hypothetical protein
LTFAGFMQFDATSLYFWSGNDANETDIVVVAKSGGAPTTLATSTDHDFSQLVLDGDHLYVGRRFTSGVMRMNKDGSGQTIIGTSAGKEQVIGLAVDDHCVYWTGAAGTDGDHVYAAPK